jgi:UDP-2,3-diacylglucosamine pyrophosphatase LpxH
MDAIIISDLHLGSRICQTKHILEFIDSVISKELILNGDVFDSWDFRRLKKSEWKILSHLRKLSKKMKVIWINGNHDGPAEIISHLLGMEVKEEYIFQSGDKKIIVLHGHQFDSFISKHPIITWGADVIYHFMQMIDPSFWMAKQAKKASKSFLRNAKKVKSKAIEYAKKKKCDIICCGHCHYPEATDKYYNCGSWVELPEHYLEIENGNITLKEFKALII